MEMRSGHSEISVISQVSTAIEGCPLSGVQLHTFSNIVPSLYILGATSNFHNLFVHLDNYGSSLHKFGIGLKYMYATVSGPFWYYWGGKDTENAVTIVTTKINAHKFSMLKTFLCSMDGVKIKLIICALLTTMQYGSLTSSEKFSYEEFSTQV